MSDFLRPEARATLWRWREVLAGLAATGVGLWLALSSFGLLFLFGGALAVSGVFLIGTGIPRGRFRRAGGGAGIVELDEGQLSYFGPHGGGAVAVADVSLIELTGGTWIVRGTGGERLVIPVDAEGAEQLFDVFNALPGMDTAAMLAAMSSPDGPTRRIWTRKPPRLH